MHRIGLMIIQEKVHSTSVAFELIATDQYCSVDKCNSRPCVVFRLHQDVAAHI